MSEKEDYRIDLERSLIKDGPKFLSHTMMIKAGIAYISPTLGSLSFCMVYIIVGCFLTGLAGYVLLIAQQLDLAIFLGGFGVAIGTFGVSLIRPFLKWVSFNRQTGVFNNRLDRNVKLENIVSLQINNKVVLRKQALNYPCFELNMLTKNGRRINILNHNDLNQLLIDSQLLAAFLAVELIDLRREIVL